MQISVAGVNFMDTGARRAGSAASRTVPFVPGVEAAGRRLRRGYGAVIGVAPVVNLRQLPNSIKVCYPTFFDHIPTREALLARSAELFALVTDGRLTVEIGGRYPLAEAARAHRDLEARATTGKLLLLP